MKTSISLKRSIATSLSFFLITVACIDAFFAPHQRCIRRQALAAKAKDDRDEKMANFYKQRFSEAAAAQYKFERQRDKAKYNARRAQRLGVKAGEEYDLDRALDANSDDTITKIIAGAFIVSMLALLYIGLIQPIMSPPTFTNESGVTYVQDPRTGRFVEK